jgi:hypothetical protein
VTQEDLDRLEKVKMQLFPLQSLKRLARQMKRENDGEKPKKKVKKPT